MRAKNSCGFKTDAMACQFYLSIHLGNYLCICIVHPKLFSVIIYRNFLGELLKQTFKYRLDELTSVCLVLVSSESFAGACHTAAADLTHQLLTDPSINTESCLPKYLHHCHSEEEGRGRREEDVGHSAALSTSAQ